MTGSEDRRAAHTALFSCIRRRIRRVWLKVKTLEAKCAESAPGGKENNARENEGGSDDLLRAERFTEEKNTDQNAGERLKRGEYAGQLRPYDLRGRFEERHRARADEKSEHAGDQPRPGA